MKFRLKQLLTILAISAISSMTYAGGEGGAGCESKGGNHKELSAEELNNLGKHHSWHKFKGKGDADKINKQDDSIKQNDSSSKLIES